LAVLEVLAYDRARTM